MRLFVVLILALPACATSLRTPARWTTSDPAGADTLYRRHAPCSAAEREVDGLCWVKTRLAPPCPEGDIVRDGVCFLPTYGRSAPFALERTLWAPNLSSGPLPRNEQKRPPCRSDSEVEHDGVCWMPHLERPPCPEFILEHEGICLAPVLPED